ncbi:MAG: SGNH hydrolase domain-containing protein [Acidimicrobiales bacterium]
MTSTDLDPALHADPTGDRTDLPTLTGPAAVGAVGVVLALATGADMDAVAGAADGATMVATEVLLCAAGMALAIVWRRPAARRRLAVAALAATVALAVWSAVFTGVMATGAEVDAARGATVASMAGVTNWWLVFDRPLALAPLPPLAGLWLGAIVAQVVLVAAVVVRRRGSVDDAAVAEVEVGTVGRGARLALGGAVVAALWTALLGWLAASSELGSSPLGNPADLPGWLVRLLDIDGGRLVDRLQYGTDTRLAGLLVGVAVGLAAPALRRRVPGPLTAALGAVIVVALWALAPADGGWLAYGGLLVVGCAAGAVGLGAPTLPAVVSGVLAWLGRRAWAIWLWILPVAIVTDPMRSGLEGLPQQAVRVLAPVALGAASVAVLDHLLGRRLVDADGRRRVAPWLIAAEVCLAVVLVAAAVAPGQPLTVYRQSTATGGTPAVVFAGDSMPYGLGSIVMGRKLDSEMGIAGRLAALPGCSFTEGDLINRDRVAPFNPECARLRDIFREETAKADPTMVIMLAWAWELYDRRVTNDDGSTTDFVVGTPEWRERFAADAQSALDDLSRDGAVVVLLTMPCVDPDADTPNHPTSSATEPHRVAEVNAMVRQLAARNRDKAVVVDLDGEYLCPDGDYRAFIDGQLMSSDSVHFSQDGAEKLWRDYLGPRVAELLGLPDQAGA